MTLRLDSCTYVTNKSLFSKLHLRKDLRVALTTVGAVISAYWLLVEEASAHAQIVWTFCLELEIRLAVMVIKDFNVMHGDCFLILLEANCTTISSSSNFDIQRVVAVCFVSLCRSNRSVVYLSLCTEYITEYMWDGSISVTTFFSGDSSPFATTWTFQIHVQVFRICRTTRVQRIPVTTQLWRSSWQEIL